MNDGNRGFFGAALLPWAGLVLLTTFWLAVAELNLVSRAFLPSPITVFKRLSELVLEIGVWKDFLTTMGRFFAALSLAAVFGISAGIFLGLLEKSFPVYSGPVDFFRSLPKAVLFPVFMAAFGIGTWSKIGIAVFGCAVIICVPILYGIKHVPETSRKLARLYNMNFRQYFRFVVFGQIVSHFFTALVIAANYTLSLILVAEMFFGLSEDGIGRRLYRAEEMFHIDELWAYVIILGLTGMLLTIIIRVVEKRFVHWVNNKSNSFAT